MVVMGGVGGGYDGQPPGTILRQPSPCAAAAAAAAAYHPATPNRNEGPSSPIDVRPPSSPGPFGPAARPSPSQRRDSGRALVDAISEVRRQDQIKEDAEMAQALQEEDQVLNVPAAAAAAAAVIAQPPPPFIKQPFMFPPLPPFGHLGAAAAAAAAPSRTPNRMQPPLLTNTNSRDRSISPPRPRGLKRKSG
ncbi:unnamed protein product [Vitrella brassicaformis CCMP3155]|uniref:Uncharacterized protein n=1 Tax=Vitrella brassicaformis (strain CCMP3155) TaxID=1169540 RepID=A0A0G4H3N6_VITBC|nr:unnamed protein product [Vitrella brassicaformis CCMP3155]|eukprot:CEM38341.1 unnamed protein product [Vitrella brassicaformis CCMP3155]